MAHRAITHREVLDAHTRGGFAWTRVVSQRLGVVAAVPAIRRGVHPSVLTLASLFAAVGTAGAVVLLWPSTPVGAAIVAFVGWQVAYGFDCADGQVARATGTASDAGARLDITTDFATQLAIVGTLAWLAAGLAPEWVALAAAGFVFPLFDEATGRGGDAAAPTVDRSSVAYQAVGVMRDSGVHKAVAAVSIGAGATATAGCLLALGGLGLISLAGRLIVLPGRSRAGERSSPRRAAP